MDNKDKIAVVLTVAMIIGILGMLMTTYVPILVTPSICLVIGGFIGACIMIINE
jgi:hypothetical protein